MYYHCRLGGCIPWYHRRVGGCIPWSRVCDGIADCPSSEDEQACHFYHADSSYPVHITQPGDKLHFSDDTGPSLEEFHCQTNATIPLMLMLLCLALSTKELETVWPAGYHLVPACLNQMDELDFYNFLTDGGRTTYSTDAALCPGPEETTCVKNFPGVCYSRHRHCMYELHSSGTVGCRNGGHLSSCELHVCPSHFKCPGAYCIPVHAVCDGKPDCPNGEEETNCHSISCPGLLLCRYDHTCVHP